MAGTHRQPPFNPLGPPEGYEIPATTGVIPMCECGLPAKVLAVYPEWAQRHTPYRYFLGCRKESGRCRMTMWCKLGER
ncbi:hypothetical protein LINPERPRIM_LOCUS37821, partial [Linum perenne]